jgi:hypothetical protein
MMRGLNAVYGSCCSVGRILAISAGWPLHDARSEEPPFSLRAG